jgi:hypothetical protein
METIPDPAAGMERMKEMTRRLIAVPKSEIDKRLAKEKTTKKRKR